MNRMVVDRRQRSLESLRLSVTDRCNLRCQYCMPESKYDWVPQPELLSFEELSRVVDAFITNGIRKVRLTGGEPLLRADLPRLVESLAQKPLDELALTTNGVRLAAMAKALRAAGLRQLTVSIDSLSRATFLRIARRDELAQVLAGISAAKDAGFTRLKLDTVLLRGVNDHEVGPLLEFARSIDAELRFIEYMDVGGATQWRPEHVVTRAQVLTQVTALRGLPVPVAGRGSAPAERFQLPDGQVFGVVASTTQPFCGACDRARLSADGQLFTCLYSARGTDVKAWLRSGVTNEALAEQLARVWRNRSDRGAEERARLDLRGPLLDAEGLRSVPHLEMHRRGG